MLRQQLRQRLRRLRENRRISQSAFEVDCALLDRDGHSAEFYAVGYRLHLERETIFPTVGCGFKEFGACHAHPLWADGGRILNSRGGNRPPEYFF